ncbi:MAG TPA: DUF5916 domain-containing protein [Gemmatimonadaceae bacterium]|nr:DUF5916 domain-containing protein [Gemmatimonadaceae bacterium]
MTTARAATHAAALVAALALTALVPAHASAQRPAPTGPAARGPSAAAIRPEGHRAADARRELLAIPVEAGIRVDGILDDAAWRQNAPSSDFVQAEPLEGRPATERTDVWIAFDADYLYIAAHLHDSQPDATITTDIRKDFKEEDQDDFEVLLDTFGDRRNGYVFSTNVEGARHDRQVALEGREVNQSWDAVWDVRTQRAADGWTVEMRIPFRALRFDQASRQPWGVNFSRHIRRKNEVDFWSPVPRAFNLNRVSLAGNVVGLRVGSAGRDLRVKPYIAGNTVRALGTSTAPSPRFSRDVDVGADLKAALTPGLTLDVTLNPDFGQAEADEQQVNLTQFSLFLPEKRDFFLENSGVFYIGDAARNNRVNTVPTPDEDNLLFFSRRIGLSSTGVQVPIDGGLRLTGRLTESSRLGILSINERGDDANRRANSSVFRFRQNLGRVGNDLGVFAMQRINLGGPDTGAVRGRGDYVNRVYGIDNNLRLFRTLDWNSYVVRTEATGAGAGGYAWRSTVNREGNFFHAKGGMMQLGPGFQNDLGYYRRTDIRKYLLDTGLRPRSDWLRAHGVREFHPHIVWDYQEDLETGDMVSKNLHTGWSAFFNNGAVVELSANPRYNRLLVPFKPNAKMAEPIPAGGYGWTDWMVYIVSDQSRPISTDTRIIWGGLYAGSQRTVNGSVTMRAGYRLRATLGVQRTAATLDRPNVAFVNNLVTAKLNYSFTTNMFIDALSQYDEVTRQFNANVRFNLIHHPLSDLFIVYNDQRIITPDAPVPGRALIVKFTQMLAF